MIKILALLAMLSDHIGQVFFPNTVAFTIIGRFAFPLFAWGIAKGYKRTSSPKKYAIRLLILAVVSQYPHYLLFKSDYLNVCFTLLAGLLVIMAYNSNKNYLIKIPIILSLVMVSHIFNFEYGIYGIATIFAFYLFEGKYYLIFIQAAITVFGITVYRYYPEQFISILAVIVILLLEKYDFKINRILYYSFYPVHIIVLLLLTYLL